ncbi:zinc-binding dehydrogenase [Brevundimonas sp.]|uniref:zinc-binding dehydrogenase n=1 Tax=Brevundimonas sp. TaxID=1871086 RepID=UPI001A2FE6C2|nr:zinc-binding dehydrogenase [Brevundimonas sp.]MBJ7483665.1 zinc-binding dehydrogenase [Brevundimonas sp.]
MRAAQFSVFGAAPDVLKVLTDAPVPEIGPDDILVDNGATTVNPIDCAVRAGYGSAFFLREGLIRIPLIPGRDVAGVVAAVGANISDFRVGDRVYAGVPNFASAEQVGLPAAWAAPAPLTLSTPEAASLPYVALTTWTALVDILGLTPETTQGKRVVVPRGAGGVGSFAIQLMKAWGAHVATVCSTRNVDLVRSLGADVVVDYTREDFREVLKDYDVAFDTAFDTEEGLLGTLKTGADAAYVSIVTPKLHMIDQFGLEDGIARGEAFLADRKAQQARLGRRYEWAFMKPNGAALRTIAALVDEGRIRPVIDRVYGLDQIVDAHLYCETKQAQGKIVIDITR